MIYKTLHRKLQIEQHEPHYKKKKNDLQTLHRKLQIEQHEPHYKQTLIYKNTTQKTTD